MRSIFFLVFALISFTTSAFSQAAVGIEGGIGMSSMHFAPSTYPILYTSASTGAIFSGKIGTLADIPLNKHIYFQAGLSLSRRGSVRQFSYYENDSFNEHVNQTLSIYYADAPLSVIYKSGMQGKGRFIAGIGATFSYIIGGNNKLSDYSVFKDTLTNTSSNGKIIDGSTIHAFDLGLNMCAGYELPTGLFFKVYYTIGVNDVGIGTEVDKNRMWGISAGYFFGKSRDVNKETDDLIDKTPE
jgi:Outer membrane protein beta-barrel domain